jgi:hypothetical protein
MAIVLPAETHSTVMELDQGNCSGGWQAGLSERKVSVYELADGVIGPVAG